MKAISEGLRKELEAVALAKGIDISIVEYIWTSAAGMYSFPC